MPIASVIMGVGTGVVLLAGGYGVIRGGVSIGTLIAFTVYIGMLMRPIRQTGMMLSVTMQALAAAERVFEVLDTTPEVRDRPGARVLSVERGSIEFRDVGFSYDGIHRAIDDVGFRIEPGELTALVGPARGGPPSRSPIGSGRYTTPTGSSQNGLYRKLYDLQFLGETGSSANEGGRPS